MTDPLTTTVAFLALGSAAAALIRTFRPAETITIHHEIPTEQVTGREFLLNQVEPAWDENAPTTPRPGSYEAAAGTAIVLPGGWHVPAEQMIPPISEWPAPEEKQLEPSPFLTAHQRTDVLRIARDESVEAALEKQDEYLAARHGRRSRGGSHNAQAGQAV